MTIFEIIIILISSGILSALLGLFYRFGQNQERQDNNFKFIDEKMQKTDSKIDKVDNKIDKVASDLNAKIDKVASDLNAKLDTKIDPLEKDLIQMNTRIAVIESRLSDISTNVTYLMWHNQAIPPKEELKEN
jgi:uncharacterized protein YaaN involved in tellurite resistance